MRLRVLTLGIISSILTALPVSAAQRVHSPYCQGVDIVKNGKTPQGKQRYQCREQACDGRTFIARLCLSGSIPKSKTTDCRHGT